MEEERLRREKEEQERLRKMRIREEQERQRLIDIGNKRDVELNEHLR